MLLLFLLFNACTDSDFEKCHKYQHKKYIIDYLYADVEQSLLYHTLRCEMKNLEKWLENELSKYSDANLELADDSEKNQNARTNNLYVIMKKIENKHGEKNEQRQSYIDVLREIKIFETNRQKAYVNLILDAENFLEHFSCITTLYANVVEQTSAYKEYLQNDKFVIKSVQFLDNIYELSLLYANDKSNKKQKTEQSTYKDLLQKLLLYHIKNILKQNNQYQAKNNHEIVYLDCTMANNIHVGFELLAFVDAIDKVRSSLDKSILRNKKVQIDIFLHAREKMKHEMRKIYIKKRQYSTDADVKQIWKNFDRAYFAYNQYAINDVQESLQEKIKALCDQLHGIQIDFKVDFDPNLHELPDGFENLPERSKEDYYFSIQIVNVYEKLRCIVIQKLIFCIKDTPNARIKRMQSYFCADDALFDKIYEKTILADSREAHNVQKDEMQNTEKTKKYMENVFFAKNCIEIVCRLFRALNAEMKGRIESGEPLRKKKEVSLPDDCNEKSSKNERSMDAIADKTNSDEIAAILEYVNGNNKPVVTLAGRKSKKQKSMKLIVASKDKYKHGENEVTITDLQNLPHFDTSPHNKADKKELSFDIDSSDFTVVRRRYRKCDKKKKQMSDEMKPLCSRTVQKPLEDDRIAKSIESSVDVRQDHTMSDSKFDITFDDDGCKSNADLQVKDNAKYAIQDMLRTQKQTELICDRCTLVSAEKQVHIGNYGSEKQMYTIQFQKNEQTRKIQHAMLDTIYAQQAMAHGEGIALSKTQDARQKLRSGMSKDETMIHEKPTTTQKLTTCNIHATNNAQPPEQQNTTNTMHQQQILQNSPIPVLQQPINNLQSHNTNYITAFLRPNPDEALLCQRVSDDYIFLQHGHIVGDLFVVSQAQQ